MIQPATAPLTARFEDASARSGLEMVLHYGATPAKHQIETMLGGVAALDYDGDGLLDLFSLTARASRAWSSPMPVGGTGSTAIAGAACSKMSRPKRVCAARGTAWARPPRTTITMATPICSSPG